MVETAKREKDKEPVLISSGVLLNGNTKTPSWTPLAVWGPKESFIASRLDGPAKTVALLSLPILRRYAVRLVLLLY